MKDRILAELDEGKHISGQRIAENLNISRTAVWKGINSLRKMGYEIKGEKNKGYKLIASPDIPYPEELAGLDTKIIGSSMIYREFTKSTNYLARTMLVQGAEEGTVVVVGEQTGGRGRRDREWSSPPGGLWFSVIFKPDIPPNLAFYVTMAASLAIYKGIKARIGMAPAIKWPNDLLLQDKKICGILTEIEASPESIRNAVVGIGINVNNPLPPELRERASSLRELTGGEVKKVPLLKSVLENLDPLYRQLKMGEKDEIRSQWLEASGIIGRRVRIDGLEGKVIDMERDGALVLDTTDGKKRIISGDLEYF